MFLKRITVVAVFICLAAAVVACSRPQEKKKEFFSNGRKLYEDGNYVKARLEFKNALQIDGKFADAYYWLGLTEEKLGSVKAAFRQLRQGRQPAARADRRPAAAGPAAAPGPCHRIRPWRRFSSCWTRTPATPRR